MVATVVNPRYEIISQNFTGSTCFDLTRLELARLFGDYRVSCVITIYLQAKIGPVCRQAGVEM